MIQATDVARVTTHYMSWQGLRWIPVGFASMAAAAVLSTSGRGSAISGVLVVAALVAVTADAAIGDYYDRVFGRIRSRRVNRITRGVARYAVLVPVAAVAMLDVHLHLAVLLSGLLFAVLSVGFWWMSGRGRWYWLVLALVPLLSAFTPMAGLVDRGRPGIIVLLLASGIAEIIGGTLDHRMLLARLSKLQGGRNG